MSSKRKARHYLRGQIKKPNRGLTLPGYNNLGPFNDPGVPLTKSDLSALTHDKKYGILGKRAYWTFNQADQDFLEEIEEETDVGAVIAKKVFKGKKKLSEWKLLPKDELQSLKKDEIEELEFALGTKGAITRSRAKRLKQGRITDTMKKIKKRLNENSGLNNNRISNPTSVLNLQETTQAPDMAQPDGKGSGRPAGLSETQVDKVVDVERGIPRYQFASLPWTGIWYAEDSNIQNYDYLFRMTSPYDVVVSTLKEDKNTGTGVEKATSGKQDVNDTISNSAMWYDFYKSMYKYYSVVSCKWSMLIENLGNDPIYVHEMYVNDVNPPPEATNEDMLQWNDVNSHYVHPAAIYTTDSGIKSANYNNGFQTETDARLDVSNYVEGNQLPSKLSNTLQLSGQYTPGQNDHEIRLDSEVENWSLCDTNPKLTERLLIRVKPDCTPQRYASGTNNYGRTLRIKYTVKLEYLVEFKELDTKLRWPILRQPIIVTLNEAKTDGNEPMDEEQTS